VAEDCTHAGSVPTLPGCKRKRAASASAIAARHLASRACSHRCLVGYAVAAFPMSNSDPAARAKQRTWRQWRPRFVQLFSSKNPGLPDEEGLLSRGCGVLPGRRPFPIELVWHCLITMQNFQTFPHHEVLLDGQR
jgi:hypothetical protein